MEWNHGDSKGINEHDWTDEQPINHFVQEEYECRISSKEATTRSDTIRYDAALWNQAERSTVILLSNLNDIRSRSILALDNSAIRLATVSIFKINPVFYHLLTAHLRTKAAFWSSNIPFDWERCSVLARVCTRMQTHERVYICSDVGCSRM